MCKNSAFHTGTKSTKVSKKKPHILKLKDKQKQSGEGQVHVHLKSNRVGQK